MTDQEAWVAVAVIVFGALPAVITFGICYCKRLDHEFRILHPADATEQWTTSSMDWESEDDDDGDDDEEIPY